MKLPYTIFLFSVIKLAKEKPEGVKIYLKQFRYSLNANTINSYILLYKRYGNKYERYTDLFANFMTGKNNNQLMLRVIQVASNPILRATVEAETMLNEKLTPDFILKPEESKLFKLYFFRIKGIRYIDFVSYIKTVPSKEREILKAAYIKDTNRVKYFLDLNFNINESYILNKLNNITYMQFMELLEKKPEFDLTNQNSILKYQLWLQLAKIWHDMIMSGLKAKQGLKLVDQSAKLSLFEQNEIRLGRISKDDIILDVPINQNEKLSIINIDQLKELPATVKQNETDNGSQTK
ncbi:MAG: hypothetical protein ACP5JE_05030 [Thermoplasmata archaeon]